MTDEAIESEIQNKGLNAPRITPGHIEKKIVSQHFFTAEEGALGAYHSHDAVHQGSTPSRHSATALPLLTFCVLILENGFTVTGESACASPENFDEEIGRKIARQNAVDKIWPLEGYLLKQRLH
ncbi:MAG: Gp49 family protein [Xanthomonadales bacterium]|nr:Gp49 family protein [Xanthomonadales bacterium]